MDFLSKLGNFITEDILGIEKTPTKDDAKKNNKDIKVFNNENSSSPLDSLEISKKESKENNNDDNKISEKATEKILLNTPAKNINIHKLIKDGKYKEVAGILNKRFEELTEQEQKTVIQVFQHSVKKYDQDVAEGKINPDASVEELIIKFAQVMYEMISSGDFENIEEIADITNTEDINKELGENFGKLSNKNQINKLKAIRKNDDKKLQHELNEVKDLPEKEKAKAEKRIKRKHRLLKRSKYTEILGQQDSKSGANAIILLDSDDMNYGATSLLSTRSSEKIKRETADYADYNFTKNLISNYNDLGDEVNTTSLKEYTSTFVAYKSADAIAEYEANYNLDRSTYERAMSKVMNGEVLTPEEEYLVKTMNTELYTATAQGIGNGIIDNIYTSRDEKATLITQWENDAKSHNDYDIVINEVQNHLSTKSNVEYLKEKIKENNTVKYSSIEEKQDNIINNTHIIIDQKSNTPNIKKTYTTQTIKNTQKIKYTNNNDRKKEYKNSERNINKNNPIIIRKEIEEVGVHETIEKYGTSAITTILNTPSLKHLRVQIAQEITSSDYNSLREICNNCTNSAFIFVYSLIKTKDFAERLKNERINNKGLCYDTLKKIENMESNKIK